MKVKDFVFELASFNKTVLGPIGVEGMTNVVPENEPRLSVMVVPLRVIGAPSKVAVIVLEAAKPEPDTVTIVPTGPLVLSGVIAGTTMKFVVARYIGSVAVMTWLPAIEEGTLNCTLEKLPPAAMTTEGIVVTALPS